MLKKFIIVICVLSAITSVYLLANNQGDKEMSKNVLGTSTTTKKVALIDVREPSEYLAGHADGAINVPLGDILAGKSFGIDKNQVIQVYCRSGIRAGQAKTKLEKDGYKNVTSIGGLVDWERGGGKVCKSDKPNC